VGIGGDDRGGGTSWARVAGVLVALFIAFLVLSAILKLVKLLVIGALIFIGVAVVLKALQPRR
jgi:hypothetical protein